MDRDHVAHDSLDGFLPLDRVCRGRGQSGKEAVLAIGLDVVELRVRHFAVFLYPCRLCFKKLCGSVQDVDGAGLSFTSNSTMMVLHDARSGAI